MLVLHFCFMQVDFTLGIPGQTLLEALQARRLCNVWSAALPCTCLQLLALAQTACFLQQGSSLSR